MSKAQVMAAAVSRETPIYELLLTWAVWATERRQIPLRRDELAAGFTIDQATVARIAEMRQRFFPASIEAVDKAVAALRTCDEPLLFELVDDYFLDWQEIPAIAAARDMSEYQVTEYLRRALRLLARSVPAIEGRVRAAAG